MYSRYPNYRFGGGVKLPNNYSGNAFPTQSGVSEQSLGKAEDAIAQESALSAESEVSQAAVASETEKESAEVIKTAESVECAKSVARLPRLPFKLDIGRVFSRGFGFEELLILALILLISQGSNDDDTILLLILLLFIG